MKKVIQKPDIVLVLTDDDYRMIKMALKHYRNSITSALLSKLKRSEAR